MNREIHRGELIALGILSAVLVASVVWHPYDEGGFVICPFRLLTGLPCMGCGLTRSFCAVAKGHVERGFEFHWLGPLLFLAACVYWVRGLAVVTGFGQGAVGSFDAAIRRWRVARVVLVAMLVAWIVRLALLGYAGQLSELAHQGTLLRLFAG